MFLILTALCGIPVVFYVTIQIVTPISHVSVPFSGRMDLSQGLFHVFICPPSLPHFVLVIVTYALTFRVEWEYPWAELFPCMFE